MKIKKFFAASMGTLMAFSAMSGGYINAADIGDVNNNGNIGSDDALEILQYVVGTVDFDAEKKARADIDGNGYVDSSDAFNILQYIVRLKESLYERFAGSYNCYFGDEKTTGYVSDNLTIYSFSIEMNSIGENNTVSGVIHMDTAMMRNAVYEYTSVISDGIMNIDIKGTNAQVNMDIDFTGDEMTGTINKAVILGKKYSFPLIYMVKN